MRQVDNSYQNIRAQAGAYYEYRVVLGGNRYGMSQLRSINFDSALFEGNGPQIGNTYSAQCTVQLFEESANWPRMAQFDVEARLCSEDGNQQTNWFPLGRFYTDTRYDDTFGSLTIQAFDGMLKLEKSWTDKIPSEQLPATWPITSRAYASMIQTANLAQFEDLTQLDNTVPLVGLDTSTTIRDVLKTIAAANGGNWIMATVAVNGVTTEKLRLVKFRNPPEITVEATTADYVYLGTAMKSINRSPSLVGISAVHLETMGGTEVYAGDDTGYQLNGSCEFSDTNGVAELCLENVEEYVYKPFTASNAYLDLITEPGDIVVADGNAYQVMRLSWQLGKTPVATIAADYDQEIDHEYTITSAQAKQYRKVMAATDEKLGDLQDEFSTAIQQTEQQISLVAQSKVSQTEFDAAVESLQSQIDGNIQSWSGNVVPTLNNSPASDWTTPALKAEHVGDMYFINSDAGIPEAGNYYRFEENNGVYSWQLLTDSALSEALAQAQAAMAAAEDAQETADEAGTTARLKGRIFVRQPTASDAYDVGDLWVNATYGTQYDRDILRCKTAKSAGAAFKIAHWQLASKYTDDSTFLAFQTAYNATITEITGQLDQKAETYYQEADPATEWGAAVAGIAVAGVTVIGISGGSGHGGDLWYRTSDNTTWFYDENQNAWVQQDVPKEVFDQIDGKAQIFISTPYPPYNEGDLWFDSNKSEIMTCIRDRAAGEFVASDWEKRNKYTDDTAADQAKQQLAQFKSEFTVQPSQIKAEVEKRVIKDKSDTINSFGWVLSDTAHTWYSNGDEVMKASQSGLEVQGKITATSGVIGQCTIDENGMLQVPSAQITGKIDVGQLTSSVVTQYTATYQYYVSTSATSKSGGSWVNNLDSWSAGKYIWRRTQTVTHYSNGTTRTVYSPNTTGVYDAYLTTKVGTDGTDVAQKRVQIIYRSYTVGSLPTAPGSWVEAVYASDNTTGKQNTWTSVRPLYSSTYPAIYTAQQAETLDGTVTTNAQRLEANTTIIDGNNIITGSISASKIAVDDLSAFAATIGGWSISATGLNKKTSKYNVEINSPVSPTDSSKAFHVQYAKTAGGALASKFYVRYDGYMHAEDAYIAGTVYATAGKIGDCEIKNGKLTVGVSNVPIDVVMYSYSETQYRLSNSNASLTGSYEWSTALPTWTSGKYIWTRTRNVTKKASQTEEVETFRPSEDGVYDKSLTEALQKATNAQTTASDASSSAGSSAQRTQTIYFAKSQDANDNSYPPAYTTWATAKTKYYLDPNTGSNVIAGVQGEWTSVRPLYTKDYPSIYIATQTQTVTQYANGTGTVCSCTTPQLEVSTTVIDGSHILTRTIDASAITVKDLSAFKATINEGATIGGFHIEATYSGSTVTGGKIYHGKSSLDSYTSGVYVGTDGIALGYTSASSSNASNGGVVSNDPTYEEGTGQPTIGGGGGTGQTGSTYSGFKVTSDGKVTCSDITVTGGSININNNFRVTTSGDLYAASGWFSGNVTAQNILAGRQYDPYSGQWTDAGTFHGSGLTGSSVSTGQTDNNINGSLANADWANNMFTQNDDFYTATWLRCSNLVVGGYHLGLYPVNIGGTDYFMLGFDRTGPLGY